MINESPEQAKNFIETFGYLRFSLPPKLDYDQLITDVNKQITTHLSLEWAEIVRQKRGYAFQSFADNSKVATDFLVNWLDRRILPILGKNYLYIESDVSVFFEAGSAWHRDAGMRLPVYKFLLYLDYNSSDISCDFHIIPGSHHVDSAYSSLLQKGLAWPDKWGFAGGLSENEFFPHGSDQTNVSYDHAADPIPNTKIPIVRGNAVLFSQAAIHAAKSSIPVGKPRRLITFSFCANPIDLSPTHYKRDANGEKLDNSQLIKEIYHTIALQSKRLGVSGYGSELQKFPDYIKAHGVDWERVREIVVRDCSDYEQEDGSKGGVQVDKMTNFLLQNIPDIDNSINIL